MSQAVFNPHEIHFLTLGHGKDARDIAYSAQPGNPARAGLFWLGGFQSSMNGEKAAALSRWALANDRGCTRMDYSGHGLSGGNFEDGTITRWLEEALGVFENVTRGPQVVVGSSMGGWLALLLAQALGRENRIAGMVLIAPAWDMTERLIGAHLTDKARSALETDGFFIRPSAYEDSGYMITQKLIEDGRRHLIADAELYLGCPVHILHGKRDDDVAWQHGHSLMTQLPQDDVSFTLIPDGDHRLSRAQDLELLMRAIEAILQQGNEESSHGRRTNNQ